MGHRAVGTTIVMLLTIGTAGCARLQPRPPVVGFAYTMISANYRDLAAEAVAARGLPATTFLLDTATEHENSEAALAFAASLVGRSDIAVVVGPSNSRHALATAPAYNAAGLAQLVPSATSRRVRSAGPSTFVLVPDDSVEGE